MRYSVITASEGCCTERVNVLNVCNGRVFFGDFMQLCIVLKGVLIVGDSKLFMVHLGGIAGYH